MKAHGVITRDQRFKDPKFVLRVALDGLKPIFELRNYKVAAQQLRIPAYIHDVRRSYSIAMKWLIQAAYERKDGLSL